MPDHPPAPSVDYIRRSRAWMHQLRQEALHLPAPLTAEKLERAVGRRITSCHLWHANWRNRLYRVQTADGDSIVAKQACVGSEGQLVQAYESLCSLAKLEIAELRMPRPIALLLEQRCYLMEEAPGQTIADLLQGREHNELIAACERAARVLAAIHHVWTEAFGPVPLDELFQDLMQTPGEFSTGQQKTLKRALDAFADVEVAVGQPYLDFKPPNVFCDRDHMALIDPPEERLLGIMLWDVSMFCGFLRRELWKTRLLRPWRRQRDTIENCVAAFVGAYASAVKTERARAVIDPLLLQILELQRIGQLMSLQLGKLRLARLGSEPLAAGLRIYGMATAAAPLPVLALQKRILVQHIHRLMN